VRHLTPIQHPFDLRLELPGSKSFANRAIVCAALANAPCTIGNISPADDTALMLNLLADLGWRINRANPLSTNVRIEPPLKPYMPPHPIQLYAGGAGTVARFAAALVTVLPGQSLLDGNERMRERPMGELVGALRQLGARIEGERLPLAIDGASLRGGNCTLRGDVSSQFLSALLMVAPTRGAGVEIEIEGDLASKPYVEMTLQVMRAFGIPDGAIEHDGYRRFHIKPAAYQPVTYACPPDATAAGYFWAAAAVTRSQCVIGGLTRQDAQGDVALVELLERMGCRVVEFPNGLGVDARRVGDLKAIEADLSGMPDGAQTLAVVCAFARGTSRLTGLRTLRVKETDRIAALQAGLMKLGVTTRAGDDWLEVDGHQTQSATPAPLIHTHDDHRMAMSFAIAALRTPLKIENPECVSKSFPAFWDYWQRMQGQEPGAQATG
jgi:3-phosphoshikimate 1-carboxyvinyltransferase